jgi:hypothetical protein
VGTNAAFLVPDHIRKKFVEGWVVHVPLTYLTDKGCLLKEKVVASSSQNILTIDEVTGQIQTTSKSLADEGELDLTFDEWHQAWRRLLELIKTYLPQEFPLWETHYSFILNNENRAEMWPLYLAYDAEIRKKSVYLPIDPSAFSIGVWNDLEVRYTAKKVYSLVQSDLMKHQSTRAPSGQQDRLKPKNPAKGSSFREHHHSSSDNSKSGRCIFCGDRSKDHLPRNCSASSNTSGAPCHLYRAGPSGPRQSRSGKRYCYAWNGASGCDLGPTCTRGEHFCTLCGAGSHTAQQCDVVA